MMRPIRRGAISLHRRERFAVSARLVGGLRRLAVAVLLGICPACLCAADEPASTAEAKFSVESITGRVVYTAEAMNRLHGARSVPEAAERQLALQTTAGRLHPLLEDVRGRAFRVDERLRRMNVELLVRRYEGSPIVQVMNVYEIAPDGKFEIDYWCEICAIAMFELKTCECCQGEIELRRRRVVAPAAALKP